MLVAIYTFFYEILVTVNPGNDLERSTIRESILSALLKSSSRLIVLLPFGLFDSFLRALPRVLLNLRPCFFHTLLIESVYQYASTRVIKFEFYTVSVGHTVNYFSSRLKQLDLG